ncbi:hypothetical protein ZWY2020_055332 [Hordeum vulgare]|nr:hypothetical protein ZWY2020_055332 [Hordeum vulgare]
METWWPQCGLHLALLLTGVILYRAISPWRYGHRPLPLPPGPRALPFLGNIFYTRDMTHRGLARLSARYGGLLHLRVGRLSTVVVSTSEIARLVLQVNDRAFANRPASGPIAYLTYGRADMVFAQYGPFWREMRKLCVHRLFSHRRAASWAAVHDEVDNLIRDVARYTGSVVNLGELVFNMSMNITLRAALGMRNEGADAAEFVAIVQEFAQLFAVSNSTLADYVPWVARLDLQGIDRRMVAARAALDRFIDRAIDEHLAHPKPVDATDADMVDGMLAFLVENPRSGDTMSTDSSADGSTLRLTRDNIKATIMDVMIGGTGPVAMIIEWLMSELLRNPEEMKRVQNELAVVVGLHRQVAADDLGELPYLRCAVKETLRVHPPGPLLQHEAAEDCIVAGCRIPKNTRVLINVWAIGRDSEAWKDAGAFRPSRFDAGEDEAETDYRGAHFQLLPFGSGRRSCPAMQLGMHAVEMALARLLHGFDWNLPNGMAPEDLDMEEAYGATAPRGVRLCAVPVPRLSCPGV